MKKFLRLFMSEYEMYLDPKHEMNCFEYPKKLLQSLEKTNPENVLDQFIRTIQSNPSSGLNILQKLSLLSLLILHSDQFYSILIDMLPFQWKCNEQDKWIQQNFLIPYQKFLLKCCSSSELYQKVKVNTVVLSRQLITFETIFYIINLLNQLFPSVDKISSLARYYQNKSYQMTNNYVYISSAQAVRLYISLKNIIHQMVSRPQIYLNTKEKQKIMKTILHDSLIKVNEDMKNLILNKYYLPFKHGYKTRLFRNQQQNQKVAKTINGIINSHRDTERENMKKFRSQTIINNNSLNYSLNDSCSLQNSFHPKLLQYSMGSSLNLEKKDSNSNKLQLKKRPSFTIQVFQQNEQQIIEKKYD